MAQPADKDKSKDRSPEKVKPPAPPPKKKVKKPPRMPPKKPPLPPLKRKGNGKTWGGLILIIAGIVSVFVLYGMSFLPFIGALCVLIGIYLMYKGLTDVDKVLTTVTKKVGGKTRTRKVYKKKKLLNKGAILLFIAFIFFALPIFLTILQFGNYATQPYSIYNEGDGGCSVFREDLEGSGYDVTAIIGSYGEISRFPADYPLNRTILFVVGPKLIFFPTGMAYISDLLNAGGYVIILQDEGTANEGLMFLGFYSLIYVMAGGGMHANPLDLPFQDGYLCQGSSGSSAATFTTSVSLGGPSYNVKFWTAAPIRGGTTTFTTISNTPSDVWLDLNKNLQQDAEDVTQSGGYPITAQSMTGNLFLIGDPDILTNKLMLEEGNDNRAFASAIVSSITGGDTTWKIVFDEIHQIKRGYSGSFYFGLIVGIEDFLLLSWLFAPLGPYLAFRVTRRFIPKAEKPEKAKLSKIKREGVSLYSKRLEWFKRRRRYDKAISLLYKRLKRSLSKVLQLRGFDVEAAIDRILRNFPEGDLDEKRLVEAFKTFEAVDKGKRVYYENEFLKIFLEMRWVADLAG